MKKNDIISGGLSGLLNPTDAKTSTPVQDGTDKKAAAPTTVVCYRVPPEVADKIKYIAYFDRKKINAVVVEALTAYIEGWNPATEKPRKI